MNRHKIFVDELNRCGEVSTDTWFCVLWIKLMHTNGVARIKTPKCGCQDLDEELDVCGACDSKGKPHSVAMARMTRRRR